MPGPFDYYMVLGVGPTATGEEIRRAYKTRMRATHPDLATDPRDQARRTRQATRINAANDVLSDPVQRAAYDATRATHRPVPIEPSPTPRPPAATTEPDPVPTARPRNGNIDFLRHNRAGQWLIFVALAVIAYAMEANAAAKSAGIGFIGFFIAVAIIQPLAARPRASSSPIGQILGGIASLILLAHPEAD
jgi:molecular chaperone DnaJ